MDPICWDCTRHFAEILGELEFVAEQLAVAATGGARLRTDGGTPGVAALPWDEQASQFANALHALLVRCARDLEESRGIPFFPRWGCVVADFIGPLRPNQRRGVPAGYVPVTADVALWLRHHVTELRQLDSAPETVTDIITAHERGIAIINRPTPPVYRGPCPADNGHTNRGKPKRCDASLYGPRTDAFVTCGACSAVHDVAKLEQRHLADLGSAVFGFNDLLRVLKKLGEPVTPKTLSRWITADKLKPHRWRRRDGTITNHWIHRADAGLYRLSDARRVRADSRAATTSKDRTA